MADIDLSELRFLAESKNVDIEFTNVDGVEWVAVYKVDDGTSFPMSITGVGNTIEEALRELYWKIIS